MLKSYHRKGCFVSLVFTLTGCGGSDPPTTPPPPVNLDGTWRETGEAGFLRDIHVRIGPTNDWFGYTLGCTPANNPACRLSGPITLIERQGLSVRIELAPETPCTPYDARVTGNVSGNNLTGTIVYSGCTTSNTVSAPISLNRG